MTSEPRTCACDECGQRFFYDCCERAIICDCCSTWHDSGRDCDCPDCRTDDAAANNVQRIAAIVHAPVVAVHAVIEAMAASAS